VVAEKKNHCRPANITITDTVARQDLLDNTTARIVTYQTIVTSMKNQQTNLLSGELTFSFGFDGSTGQAITTRHTVTASLLPTIHHCLLRLAMFCGITVLRKAFDFVDP